MAKPLLSLDLQLGGVAPTLLRELSGVYPTFVSAFKELVSNAYDADAENVRIWLSDDLSTITVEDDGIGMTPFDLRQHYLRVGGSGHRSCEDRTPAGRQPIGRKGIGFLAVARYCKRVELLTHCRRREVSFSQLAIGSAREPEPSFVADPLSVAMVSLASVSSVRCSGGELSQNEYKVDGCRIELAPEVRRRYAGEHLTVGYCMDCGRVDSQITIDYDYLLGLDDSHHLDTLGDFCSLRLLPHDEALGDHFTRVTLHLHDFVRRELAAPRKSGGVRNIASSSGLEQFLWHLSRCTPVPYDLPERPPVNLELLDVSLSPTPFKLGVLGGPGIDTQVRRPVPNLQSLTAGGRSDVACQPICIEQDGLAAQGYLLGFPQPVFPAELRGIAIRVRGVDIGSPSYLGMEGVLPKKLRPLLNQVVGEVIVREGMDAVDTITPGREGFYADSSQFRTLRRCLVGDGVGDCGALGLLLQELWQRRSIHALSMRIVQEARRRRQSLLDVAHAVTALSLSSRYGSALCDLFSHTDIPADGLAVAPRHQMALPESVGAFVVKMEDLPEEDYVVDNRARAIRLNKASDIWDSDLHILGRDFRVELRDGAPNGPLCEIDFAAGLILLNWQHATRSRLGDAMYIRSALCWRIAYLAANRDVDLMMNLAHRLLSFTE